MVVVLKNMTYPLSLPKKFGNISIQKNKAMEYHADLASRGAQLLVGERGHVRAVDCDGAALLLIMTV